MPDLIPVHRMPSTASDERMHEINNVAACWCHPVNEFVPGDSGNEWRVTHRAGEYAVSDETQARINDVLLEAYNRGRAAFAADLAEQGEVVVDRPLLERLGKAYEMQDDIYCNAIFEAVHDLLVATMKPSHV